MFIIKDCILTIGALVQTIRVKYMQDMQEDCRSLSAQQNARCKPFAFPITF